ncbi:hypothetical protein L209DRAFT_375333 [Thermothelomyces heterothallicus CBS 203.75]
MTPAIGFLYKDGRGADRLRRGNRVGEPFFPSLVRFCRPAFLFCLRAFSSSPDRSNGSELTGGWGAPSRLHNHFPCSLSLSLCLVLDGVRWLRWFCLGWAISGFLHALFTHIRSHAYRHTTCSDSPVIGVRGWGWGGSISGCCFWEFDGFGAWEVHDDDTLGLV